MHDIVASVVAYGNDQAIFNKTIDSLLNTDLKSQLFIIDNSPSDELREVCIDPKIKYIYNNKNYGFGAGHNIAIRRAARQAKYFLILNPDVYFNPGTLESLFVYMEKNPQVGSIMPKVLYPDGALQYLCRLLPNPLDVALRKLNGLVPDCVVDFLSKYELRFADYNHAMNVPYLSGCFMFIRSEVFEKTGIFDERFFLYFEDVDLARRIHRFYDTVYYPEVFIYHAYSRGSDRNPRHLKYLISSALKYFNKWGWFFDRERVLVNRRALERLRCCQTLR